jgi:hypothetical protein
MRKTLVAMAAIIGLFSLVQTPAHAQYISKYNPYRAFNTSGVNYGSQRLQYQYNHMYGSGYGYGGYGYPAYGYRSGYRGYASPVYSQQVYRSGWYPRYYTNSCR